MLPEPHVCCVCKREVVMTDCLPAVCYRCREREAEKHLPRPAAVVDVAELDRLYEKFRQRLAEDGGEWPEYTGPDR